MDLKEINKEVKALGDFNKNILENVLQTVQDIQSQNLRMETRIAEMEAQVAALRDKKLSTSESETNSYATEEQDVTNSAISDKEQKVTRLTAVADDSWYYDGSLPDEVNLETDEPISVTGFLLYGSHSGPATLRVAMQLSMPASGRVLASHQATMTSDGSKSLFPVRFPSPVDLDPDTTYTASVIIGKGTRSWRGKGGLEEVSSEGVQFKFSDPENYYLRNGSDATLGQIPGLLYLNREEQELA